ncbi:MAG: hypothetical protein JWO62_415 [Acidimicrobiaceae bacterium]|nr:hypothetical protein [Acidimicrobiaceae bacterium]
MAWLLRQGEVLASVEIPGSLGASARAIARREAGSGGALLLCSTRLAHSIGAKFDVDVAYLDGELVVVATSCMARNRVGRPHRRARSVLEAEAGAFDRWALRPGDRLEIKE